MGTRVEAMRASIVEAAFAEFAERGYHQTGIADIARRLGLCHGTFYRYFENKRDILEHVVDEVVGRLLDILGTENGPEAATTLEEYRAQSLRIALAFGELLDADPRVSRLLLFEATSIDRDLTERLLGLYDLSARTFDAYLENGVRCGYLRADLDCAATGDAVAGIALAATIRGLRTPMTPDERERLQEAFARLLVDGAKAEPH